MDTEAEAEANPVFQASAEPLEGGEGQNPVNLGRLERTLAHALVNATNQAVLGDEFAWTEPDGLVGEWASSDAPLVGTRECIRLTVRVGRERVSSWNAVTTKATAWVIDRGVLHTVWRPIS